VKITVVPIGLIKKYAQGESLDVREGTTSRELIGALKIPRELKMVSYVNGKQRGLDQALKDGDEVKLVTLLTGG
jgi:sulfur carrier protein ThiS